MVEGTPRPDYKPKVQNANFLSKFRGTLWIDKLDYQWVKADCESIEPVSIGLFLARLSKGAHIAFEQTRINNEVWLPNRMTLRFDARLALVAHKIGEIEQTTSNYKKYQAESHITGVVEKKSP